MSRIKKENYYLELAGFVGQRSTCFRNRLGAIIVRDDQIVSAGYIGAPRKTRDCLERKNCLRDENKIPHGQRYEACRSVHAEQNAIINAARAGVSILNGDLYISGVNTKGKRIDTYPCFICKRMIINAGLKRVICSDKNGKVRKFLVRNWVKDWQSNDIYDDKYQYGQDQNKNLK